MVSSSEPVTAKATSKNKVDPHASKDSTENKVLHHFLKFAILPVAFLLRDFGAISGTVNSFESKSIKLKGNTEGRIL